MNKYIFVGNERQKKIIEYLQKEHFAKTQELVEQFGATDRTIREDIKYLKKTFPIEVRRGKYGGGIYMDHGDFLV